MQRLYLQLCIFAIFFSRVKGDARSIMGLGSICLGIAVTPRARMTTRSQLPFEGRKGNVEKPTRTAAEYKADNEFSPF